MIAPTTRRPIARAIRSTRKVAPGAGAAAAAAAPRPARSASRSKTLGLERGGDRVGAHGKGAGVAAPAVLETRDMKSVFGSAGAEMKRQPRTVRTVGARASRMARAGWNYSPRSAPACLAARRMSALAPARPIGLDAPTFAGLNPAQRRAVEYGIAPDGDAGASAAAGDRRRRLRQDADARRPRRPPGARRRRPARASCC